jgi:hypothetical protein
MIGFIGTAITLTEPESDLCYDRQSIGRSVLVSSIHLGLRTRFLLLSNCCGFVYMGLSLSLSDERTGLSFTIAAGPRQGSYFRVRVPWDS